MAKRKKPTPVQYMLRLPRISGGLHQKLVKSAAANKRSLNSEMISRLEESYRMQDIRTVIRDTIQEMLLLYNVIRRFENDGISLKWEDVELDKSPIQGARALNEPRRSASTTK